MKKNKQITYIIKIDCIVNEKGVVIPNGASESIKDEKGKYLDMLVYPQTQTIMMIWLGKYFSYPKMRL